MTTNITLCCIVQIVQCYPEELSTFPEEIQALLRKHAAVLDHDVRMVGGMGVCWGGGGGGRMCLCVHVCTCVTLRVFVCVRVRGMHVCVVLAPLPLLLSSPPSLPLSPLPPLRLSAEVSFL